MNLALALVAYSHHVVMPIRDVGRRFAHFDAVGDFERVRECVKRGNYNPCEQEDDEEAHESTFRPDEGSRKT